MSTYEFARHDERFVLAAKLLKWAETLYEDGFDTFVECYEPQDLISEIEECENCTRRQHLTLEQRCKLHMAWCAELWDEQADNCSWAGVEHRWEHGY